MTEVLEPEFDVALSFAGEQRDYVRAVASELAKHGIKVFFDEQNEVDLWGKDLGEELQRIYMKASNVVVMFVSEDYATKSWPIHERRSALSRAINERREYVLPVRFDNTELPGLSPSVSYLPLTDRTPAKLAEDIMRKLVKLGGKVPPKQPEFRVDDPNETGTCRVVVHNEQGDPVAGASVQFVAQNGTSTQAHTGSDGVAEVPAAVRRNVAVFVAHPDYRAGYYREHDSGSDLTVTLPRSPGVQSALGSIPGFKPRMSPIGDYHNTEGIPRRTYMYLTNGSINGSVSRPGYFTVGEPMMLEDSEGNQVRATCVAFVGSSTLWEYEFSA
ncbi:TIR domain-containing protein [Mycobacteroides abscessus]|uniref:TIR domain-containing protein n=1 Tax=Mycobacteroides abscessus TaxID=36809 RepID=UPI0019D1B95C|nr:TIR domain-containing protein [Mycobacteroides abscessus]MBN7411159.1 TIR domain-containing protein [Mycobacteroides abscessus subsp. abscessus]